MLIIYNLGIRLYYLFVFIFSFFHSKAKKWFNGRKNIFQHIQQKLSDNRTPIIWFHVASLGEFEQGKPVFERIKQLGNYKILITFFSPSGYEVRKNDQNIDYVFYLPLDTRQNACKFLDLVKPAAVFFVKYEFWYHFLHETQKRNIPLILFSGAFRPQQIFFKGYGGLFREILKKFTHIFVQNALSKTLLEQIGVSQVSMAGDTRFDRVRATVSNVIPIPKAEKFKGDEKLLIVGSCWGGDLDILVPFLNAFEQPLKTMIAPHEIKEKTLERLENQLQKKVVRFSKATLEQIGQAEVLLIDNVGMLANLYQYADFAYIGGAFGEGLHNILEPATFGIPVLFGKDYRHFPEAYHLIDRGGAFSVKDEKILMDIFTKLYQNEEQRLKAGKASENYILENIGGTDKVIDFFQNLNL
jgi:3-deoxy-D-manno-octulosonic-acid transferase